MPSPDLKFVDVPDNKVFAYAQTQFLRRAVLVANIECDSERYSTQAAGFMVANAKGTVKLQRYVNLEGGVNNFFDRNYALAEGFSEPGRNFFVNSVLTNL